MFQVVVCKHCKEQIWKLTKEPLPGHALNPDDFQGFNGYDAPKPPVISCPGCGYNPFVVHNTPGGVAYQMLSAEGELLPCLEGAHNAVHLLT